MCEVDEVDRCTRVCSGKNKTDFTNHTVSDNLVLLLELVGEDGQRDDVAVLNQLLSVLGGLGIVKERIRVSTIRAVFQEGMPKNVLRRVMLVRPDKGNLSLVLMRE